MPSELKVFTVTGNTTVGRYSRIYYSHVFIVLALDAGSAKAYAGIGDKSITKELDRVAPVGALAGVIFEEIIETGRA